MSNNSNDINHTNITVNTDDVSDITIVDFPHKVVLSISEQLRNIRAERYSKYPESKRNKEKPLTLKNHLAPHSSV